VAAGVAPSAAVKPPEPRQASPPGVWVIGVGQDR
jgi:hypothetical protein